MKQSLLLLLFALIVDVPAPAQTMDGRAGEAIGQDIHVAIESYDDRQSEQSKIAPGHVPANIYDAVSPRKDLRIIDGPSVIRDFREAPQIPRLITLPERGTFERTNGIIYDALPQPDRRCYPNNGPNAEILYKAFPEPGRRLYPANVLIPQPGGKESTQLPSKEKQSSATSPPAVTR